MITRKTFTLILLILSIVLALIIISRYMSNNYDIIGYELKTDNNVYGYCLNKICVGIIKTNTTITDVNIISE